MYFDVFKFLSWTANTSTEWSEYKYSDDLSHDLNFSLFEQIRQKKIAVLDLLVIIFCNLE